MSDARLRETLAGLGIGEEMLDAQQWELVAHAEPELQPMSVTYEAVNEHLATLLERGELRIEHVTGEARALIDTAHRRILRRAGSNRHARLACHFHSEGAPTAFKLVANQRRYWSYMSWFDLVDTLALAADGHVAIHVLSRPEPIHFSLLGDEHVLLQDRHDHPLPRKTVWYLRSSELVTELEPKVEAVFAEATLIDPRSFRTALQWLSDYESTTVLANLRSGKALTTGLDPEEADEVAERLAELGLVDRGDNEFALSKLGSTWLEALVPRAD